jgi:hypothetical protein
LNAPTAAERSEGTPENYVVSGLAYTALQAIHAGMFDHLLPVLIGASKARLKVLRDREE